MSIVDQVAASSFFGSCGREQIEALAGIATQRSFQKGQTIFVEGETASCFYVLVSGRVKIYKLSPEGKEQVLHFFEPGDAFAEAAVFSGQKFPAFAGCIEDATTLLFPRVEFLALIKRDPSMAMMMLAELSRKLRRFANLIEDLSLREVPGRLAAHLLYLGERQENGEVITLNISKTQLASLLGTIPETLSRILARMTREGLIEITEGRTIHLLDSESLEELASGERRLG